jgi:polyisoprenoid-binding protein YceI
MTTSTTTTSGLSDQAIPGYLTGTWDLDPSHSEVAFSVRHLMLSKVRGRFATFSGSFVTAEHPLDSSVEATIDLSSIDTNSADRDAHLRSADFFDVDRHPTMTYRSTGVHADGAHWIVDGELSLHGVTRPVPLRLELHGFLPDSPFGDSRVGFEIEAVRRND